MANFHSPKLGSAIIPLTTVKGGILKVGETPYTHEQNGQTYYEYQLTKEHRNVCRDIDNLNATYGQRGYAQIEQTPYTHEQNGQTLTAMYIFALSM